MCSNISDEELDSLRKQHETFAEEIIDSLQVHYSLDDLSHDNELLTNGKFVSYEIVRAVITIAYLFRLESRKVYGVLREELRDVEKFKNYCMLIPVPKNNRYFYNYLRRVSLISELVINCLTEKNDYFSVASNCIANYQDLLYFESSGGWAKLKEISSFIYDLSEPIKVLFDYPIAEKHHKVNAMVSFYEADALVRNDVDLLDSKEMCMLKIIRQKITIQDSSELTLDIGRNVNGTKNSGTTSDEQGKCDLKDEKKAIIEYFERCLMPRYIMTKDNKNTFENIPLSESDQKIRAKEMADNDIQKEKEFNFSFTFISNKDNCGPTMFDRKQISASTSTDYLSSTHSEFSNESSSEESSDAMVSGCFLRKKLIKVLLKKRKGNLFQLKKSHKPLFCESLEDQTERRKNIRSKFPEIGTCLLSRNRCTNKESTESESCSLDEAIHRNRELSDESPRLQEKYIHSSELSLSDETTQSVQNTNSSTDSVEEKNLEICPSSDQSPNGNSDLQRATETNNESSPKEKSHLPCRIYSSSGSSITSESEFPDCTAGLHEDHVELESSTDSKVDSDDVAKIFGSETDEDNFETPVVARRDHSLMQPCLMCGCLKQETECSDGSSKENINRNKTKRNAGSIKSNRTSSKKGQKDQRNAQASCQSHYSSDPEETISCSREIFLKKDSSLSDCNEYRSVNSAVDVAATEHVHSLNTEKSEGSYHKNETSGIAGAVQTETHHKESTSSDNTSINTAVSPTRPKAIEETSSINIENCETVSKKKSAEPQHTKAKKKKASKNRSKKK